MTRSASGAVSVPARRPTRAQWEAIRPFFVELWWNRNLALPLVMDILEKRNGFVASKRAFKTKIEQWDLKKNNNEREMLAMLRKIKERAAEGNRSIFRIRKRIITEEAVHDYFDQKGVQWADVPDEDDSEFWADSDNVVYTPGSAQQAAPATGWLYRLEADIASDLSPSLTDLSTSRVIYSIQTYYSNMFEGMLKTGRLSLEDPGEKYPPLQFGGEFFKFHSLVLLRKQDQAYAVLSRAFGTIAALLKAGHPRLLIYLLESIAFTRSEGHTQVARELIDFFAYTSGHPDVLGPRHSITLFSNSLKQADDGPFLDNLIEKGLQVMIDQFVSNIEATHPETMGLLLTSASILKHQRNYDAASARLEQLQGLYEMVYTADSHQASHAIADLAVVRTEQRQYLAASVLLVDAMKRAEKVTDPTKQAESRIRCLMNRSTLLRAEGDVAGYVGQLRLALDLGRAMQLEEEHWMMNHVKGLLAAAPAPAPADPLVASVGSNSPASVLTPATGSSPSASFVITPTSSGVAGPVRTPSSSSAE